MELAVKVMFVNAKILAHVNVIVNHVVVSVRLKVEFFIPYILINLLDENTSCGSACSCEDCKCSACKCEV